MDEEIYFCKHCDGLIESFNEAGNHQCFRGKEHIYQDEEDNTILFVHNYENDNKENREEQVFNNEKSEVHNHLLSDYTAFIESDEDLSQSVDFQTESNPKKNAVWTKQATMALLSLYEANLQMLTDIGKKSRVWKKISEGLKELRIQVTADQVKWKFNRLYNKYKECIDNNNKSGRQFEEIFHKEKKVSTSSTLSSSILTTDEKKRKHDIIGSKNISKSKKLKIDAISSEKNLPPVDKSPKLKTTPIADVKQTARNQQRIQSMEILENIKENQKARDEKMTKYLKMKEKEMDLKKKAIDVRETEMQVKRDVATEKLKFNEKKHKDWLNIEKLKCELLKKLLKNRTDSEESD
ncbi:GSCOCG00009261001-RA-CDS [Cotesia congregata]|nr:GSCOCG00009261001-RA-CDS [Cotesia congregata]